MDWKITIKFKKMPTDADKESMRIFIEALLFSNSNDVEYEIVKMEKSK